jgi:hypothetical protein
MNPNALIGRKFKPTYTWYRPHRDLALYPVLVSRVARVHKLSTQQKSQLREAVINAINAGDLRMCSPITTIPQAGTSSITGHPLIATSYPLFNDWLVRTNRDHLQITRRAYRGPLRAGVVKQQVLISRHKPYWKTIKTDLKYASANGLNKSRRRGGWHEATAVTWAKTNGRYSTTPSLPSRVYRIR